MKRCVQASLWVLIVISWLQAKEADTLVFVPPNTAAELVTAANCEKADNCDKERVEKVVTKVRKNGTEAKVIDNVATRKGFAVKSEGPAAVVERLPNGELKVSPPTVSIDQVKSRLRALSSEETSGVKSDSSRNGFLGGESLLKSSSLAGSLVSGLAQALGSASLSGHTGSIATGPENYQEKADSLKNANDLLRSSANSFSSQDSRLSNDVKNIARANLMGFARENIEFPLGSQGLGTNRLYATASVLPDGDLSTTFMKQLFQKDLQGASLSSKLNSLNDLAKDKFFQEQAAKTFGDKNLNGFNLAVLGANLISLPGSTIGDLLGTNKVLNGQLDALIEGFDLESKGGSMGSSISVAAVEDWMEAARILSSDSVTDKIDDKDSVETIKKSYNDLVRLMRKLGEYKSTDLLKLVSVPLKYSPKKSFPHLKEKIMSSVARSMKVEDTAVTSLEGFEPEAFKERLVRLQKDLLNDFENTEKFLSHMEKLFEDSVFTAKWALLDQPSFITTRRSLALLSLNVYLAPLEDLKKPQTPLTSLIANSFEYIEIRRKDAKQRQVMQAKEDSRNKAGLSRAFGGWHLNPS